MSSSTHPRPHRRQPTSFLGGPFLVDQLHRLPLSLVDLIFTFPSSNPTPSKNHADLVVKGIEIIILAADVISKEKFLDWSPAKRKAVVDRSLRHSCLRELAFAWALDERARDQGPFNEEDEKLESLVLAIAGGLRTEMGDGVAVQWLRVVLDETFDESAKKIEEIEKEKRLAEASREPTPIDLSPPTPLVPLQAIEDSLPPQPPLPKTTFDLVQDAMRCLPPPILNSVFTHPSVNPVNNFDLLALPGLAFLRSVVHTILLRNVPVQLTPDRIELLINASVSTETMVPLAKSWRLDWQGRARGAPEAFLDQRTDQLFFSLVGGMIRTFGEDQTGGWLIEVMGECVREKFEELGAGEDASTTGDVEMSSQPLSSEGTFDALGRLTSASVVTLVNYPESLVPAGRLFAERASRDLAAHIFPSEPSSSRNLIVQKAMKTTTLQDLATSHNLTRHPLCRQVDVSAQGSLLLAIFRAVETDLPEADAQIFVRILMAPVLIEKAVELYGNGILFRVAIGEGQPHLQSNAESEPDDPPAASLFDPPSLGPQQLQSLLSWVSPNTLNKALSHPSVHSSNNYASLLVEGGTPASFLSVSLTLFSRQWYPDISDPKRAKLIARTLGSDQLSRLATELGIAEKLRTQVPLLSFHLRDATIALVEGAAKDAGSEAVVRWIGSTFKTLFDQVKAEKPKASATSSNPQTSSHPPPTGPSSSSLRTRIERIARARNDPVSFVTTFDTSLDTWFSRLTVGSAASLGFGEGRAAAEEAAAKSMWDTGQLKPTRKELGGRSGRGRGGGTGGGARGGGGGRGAGGVGKRGRGGSKPSRGG